MNRGEIWQLSIDKPGLKGTTSRLVVILSTNSLAVLPLRVIVPLTPWKDSYTDAPWMVRVPPVLNSGLETLMAADALQVRSVSTSRLQTCLGSLPNRMVDEIVAAVGVVLSGARSTI